jgi:hypothetical protein
MTGPESGELDSPRLGEGGTRGEGLGDKEIFSEIGKRAAYHYIKREKMVAYKWSTPHTGSSCEGGAKIRCS